MSNMHTVMKIIYRGRSLYHEIPNKDYPEDCWSEYTLD